MVELLYDKDKWVGGWVDREGLPGPVAGLALAAAAVKLTANTQLLEGEGGGGRGRGGGEEVLGSLLLPIAVCCGGWVGGLGRGEGGGLNEVLESMDGWLIIQGERERGGWVGGWVGGWMGRT